MPKETEDRKLNVESGEEGVTTEDRKVRNRLIISLNDDAIEMINRLIKERGLQTNSTVIEFMLVNFGPWVLSADFITVLADAVRNNRLSEPPK